MNVINRVTLAGLKQNRTRTIVTIIGVILSAAMLTAVTTLVASLQAYLVDFSIADQGNWHAVLHYSDIDDVNALRAMNGLTGHAVTRSAGYAYLPGSQNNYKPYLHLLQLDQAAFEGLPINLLSGRLPEQPDEVLVTEHIFSNGGVHYQVGDELTLQLGQRLGQDGRTLDQRDGFGFVLSGEGEAERLAVRETRTFTVVGISNRPTSQVESHNAPGYTLYAPLDESIAGGAGEYSVYFRATRPSQIYSLTDQIRSERQINDPNNLKLNHDLLRFSGVSNDKSFQAVLYSLAAILLGLVVVGSVSLIHNSFSISVSERKKQFGLLSGAGATAKQLKASVFFEALAIAGIGIPLGVLAGLVGIGTTVYLLRDQLSNMGPALEVPFRLTVPLSVLAIAVGLALVTILISAYIPARRTAKMSAMDAIRQTADIKLTAGQVKTSRLTRRLFGFGGDLALKNLKRNRRRYRSTVFSLFISVVLFVSATAFSGYLRDSVSNVYVNTDYDFHYNIGQREHLIQLFPNVFSSILALDSVNAGSIARNPRGQMEVSPAQLPAAYYQARISEGVVGDGQPVTLDAYIYSIDSTTFAQYAAGLGLDVEQLRNPDSPAAIVIDKQHYYHYEQKRYLNTSIFGGQVPSYLPVAFWQRDGERMTRELAVIATADSTPLGVPPYAPTRFGILMIIDDSLVGALTDQSYSPTMYFSVKDVAKADAQIRVVLQEAGLPTAGLNNVAEALRANRNVITIMSVFSYGFIVLISLITIANVFNTITTNVNLRRREFAMLRSVGMTEQGFKRMLDFECIFYGLKALLYGLPVSVGVTWLIYRSIQQGVEMPFQLPLHGIIVSTLSVFIVVFVSMKYSRDKVQKENILDALRNENL